MDKTTWTREKPSKSGVYWIRYNHGLHQDKPFLAVVNLRGDKLREVFYNYSPYEWDIGSIAEGYEFAAVNPPEEV